MVGSQKGKTESPFIGGDRLPRMQVPSRVIEDIAFGGGFDRSNRGRGGGGGVVHHRWCLIPS